MLNMKNTLMCLLFLIAFSSAIIKAQNYYYADGKRINLTPRLDKLAIITNKTNYSESFIEQKIKTVLSRDEEIKKAHENIYVVYFKSAVEMPYIEQKILSVNSLDTIVKFGTLVYYGESKQVTQIPTDEFIVRLFSLDALKELENLNLIYNCKILRNIGDEKGFLIKSNDNVRLNALQLSDLYFNSGYFEYCEPNFGYPDGCLFNFDPNDTYYSSQWALKNTGQSTATGGITTYGDVTTSAGIPGADMDVHLAWNYVKGNNNVIVGVFDTGVDSLHPDLSQNLIMGYDAHLNVYTVQNDPGSHGTATAGIIGARTNNGLGVAGIVGGDNSPNSNCKIMAFKLVSSGTTFTTTDNIARAFDTARVNNVHISSNSWGGGSVSSTLNNAIANFANNSRGGLGGVVLFSSGNDGKNPPNYPSYLSTVVCVGASTRHDQKKASGTGNQYWWGGNYGGDANGDLDLVAPTIVYTTDIRGTGGYNTSSGSAGDYYSTFNGTSASCPNAAGVAALIFSVNPNFTRSQVLEYLYRGCEKIDNIGYNTTKSYGQWNEYYGYGRVNAYNSVRLAMGFDVTPPTIVHNNIPSHSSTYPTFLTATIIDQDGSSIPNSGPNRPQIFYRFNKNGSGWTAFDSSYALSNSGNVFTFKIPGVGKQTEVQYYIKAQDYSGNVAKFPFHANPSYSYTLCYFAVGDISYETKSLASTWNPPDYGTGTSPNINFTSNYSILDVSVKINLNHTYLSDNILTIWSPNSDNNNNRICLFSRNGGSGDNINNATVKDSAVTFWNQSSPPYTNGNFKPEYILGNLRGTSSLGNWKFINRDVGLGDAPSYTGLEITLKKLSGTVSPCARLDSEADSILDFGSVNPPTLIDRNFYLKNVGNSSLLVSGVNFTGTNASLFSLVNSIPSSISPGDSGLFIVRLNTALLKNSVKTFLDGKESVQSAIMEISNNDPSKSIFKVSLLTDAPIVLNPLSFNASTVSSSQINLAYTSNLNNDTIVIVWNTSGIFTSPSGAPPSAGNPFAGGTILYVGTVSPQLHSSLIPSTTYYYKAFSYDGINYSAGLTTTATTYPLPTLNLTAIIEGLYDGSTMVSDTVEVELRKTTSPYNIIESKKVFLNNAGFDSATFSSAAEGISFYIVVNHRNSISTWSTFPQTFTAGTLVYDFTTAQNKAFGNNLVLKGGKWCIYSGDVNKDGYINSTDLILISNGANNYSEGYLSADLTGDFFVDLNDLVVCDNNVFNSVEVKKPLIESLKDFKNISREAGKIIE